MISIQKMINFLCGGYLVITVVFWKKTIVRENQENQKNQDFETKRHQKYYEYFYLNFRRRFWKLRIAPTLLSQRSLSWKHPSDSEHTEGVHIIRLDPRGVHSWGNSGWESVTLSY